MLPREDSGVFDHNLLVYGTGQSESAGSVHSTFIDFNTPSDGRAADLIKSIDSAMTVPESAHRPTLSLPSVALVNNFWGDF
ncbi:hypothetical protein WG66_016008 [Moniliophthora roreri]|nr:hypothetical protein WG66_016008 [Moniliophthora roreri]